MSATAKDPRAAVGGRWDEIVPLQFAVLVRFGPEAARSSELLLPVFNHERLG
jgi:hypothetical protein